MTGMTIVVTSGKGGVGKTTVTANLGVALAATGARVCVIDTDTGLRNLDLVMGVEQRIIYDLVDVARGECRLQQALIHDRRAPNLYLLPTSQRCDKSALAPADMRWIAASLRETFEFILLDCPAGIEEGFATAVAAADRALVVVNPDVSSVRDADRVLALLGEHGLRDVQLVVNRVRPDMIDRHDMISVADIEELLGAPALAVLPDDPGVITSTNRGEPLAFDRQARLKRTFDAMAAALGGRDFRVLEPAGGSGFFGKLRALFA